LPLLELVRAMCFPFREPVQPAHTTCSPEAIEGKWDKL
jgi:hypothetical protein